MQFRAGIDAKATLDAEATALAAARVAALVLADAPHAADEIDLATWDQSRAYGNYNAMKD